MDEDDPQQNCSSRSDSQESASRTTIESEPSSVTSSHAGSRGGSAELVRDRSTPSARHSLSSELAVESSSTHDSLSVQTSQVEHLKFTGIDPVPPFAQNISSAADNLQSVSSTVDTFSALVRPLKVFNSIANEITYAHSYAKMALGIFTCASKMILDHADSDDAVSSLLSKISEVYTFITEEEELSKVQSMLATYGKIAQQTLECADFITHYSETKSAWIKLGKHVLNETEAAIQSYCDVLDSLMQQFRDQAPRGTDVIAHHMAGSLDLVGMEYASGAGLNTSKCCLPNTRQDLLNDIQNWISSTNDNPRVLWLSGTAGKGKSAVAHTIAKWYIEHGGLGSCFCFDRTRQADRRWDKIFTTMARELADCNPIVRRALAQAVRDHKELKHTRDLITQWRELIVGPTSIASKAVAAPVLIVIEALDESGEAHSRNQILDLLTGRLNTSQLAELPANFRILLTSRPLRDIRDALYAMSHVYHISLDDVSSASTEPDIQCYISHRLEDLHDVFSDAHFKTLAQKSDGLFEWARLTCEYIKGTNRVGMDPMGRFDAVVAGVSANRTRLLDDMYKRILSDIIPEDEREEVIPLFCSVMGQILASLEPLPLSALNVMRQHFPSADCRYEVDWVVRPLSSLLTGTTDLHTPIRPLHASFYEFLTDKSRSHDLFVDTSLVQRDLAFATLRVMDSEHGLRFNICSLENSYLPNSSVPDLEIRVKESISAELSYSCRFWGTHVAGFSFESSLVKEVEAFFNGERLLWWLEALALMKSLGDSVATLSSIANWFSGHAEFTHVSDATRDTLRFVRTFATTILRSTPHLYISALPFAPAQSRMFRKFAATFPCTPRIVAGHVENWPQIEKVLHTNDAVHSVAMSPDRKRIACGLDDGTIQVWDMETGEELCAPLQGHTESITSVAFSPDGYLIVSGSDDTTVRLWDAKTGEALGSPLRGHTACVRSVVISPDGRRIVSGSEDKTIRVWDMETGKVFGAPLYGHTDAVCSVAISPDRNHIISGSHDKTIRLWDAKTREAYGVPLQEHTDCIRSIAISSDGHHIVSGSDDKVNRVWDIETGKALDALQGHTAGVRSVAISPNGKYIVSGSDDTTIQVWDVTCRVLGAPLRGHTANVLSVAISPDGQSIISGSDDRTIRVWDLAFLDGEQPEAPAIYFSSNPTHALRSATSFLQGSKTPTLFGQTKDGWVVGPEGRLLLWIPPYFHPVMYAPGSSLVIPNDTLDLSYFAHGTSWHKCRDPKAVLSS